MSIGYALGGDEVSVRWSGWKDIRHDPDPCWGHWRAPTGEFVGIHVHPATWGRDAGLPDYVTIDGLPALHRDGDGWYFRPDEDSDPVRLDDAAAYGLVVWALRRLGVLS